MNKVEMYICLSLKPLKFFCTLDNTIYAPSYPFLGNYAPNKGRILPQYS